jgi:hypothetical protein
VSEEQHQEADLGDEQQDFLGVQCVGVVVVFFGPDLEQQIAPQVNDQKTAEGQSRDGHHDFFADRRTEGSGQPACAASLEQPFQNPLLMYSPLSKGPVSKRGAGGRVNLSKDINCRWSLLIPFFNICISYPRDYRATWNNRNGTRQVLGFPIAGIVRVAADERVAAASRHLWIARNNARISGTPRDVNTLNLYAGVFAVRSTLDGSQQLAGG